MSAGHIPSTDDLRRKVDALTWFHQIDLGNGIVTPGRDKSARKLAALELPALTGKTVLDVGANDGFFSFAAERAGASRVLAVDSYAWADNPPGFQTKASFDLARDALGSRVESLYADVYDLTPEKLGTFDVVLFLGVLYHLRDPLLALERIASVTNELVVVESLVDSIWATRPVAAFYPEDEVMPGDSSNWWGPNPAALAGMLRACGFRTVARIGDRGLIGKLGHTAYNAANIIHSRTVAGRARLNWAYLSADRAIMHARR
jgi:tRNA (mo5U34)-methyltransferase